VDVDDLVVRHGDLTAVDRVSFAVDKGSVLALLGPNGAGKTSTVDAVVGLRAPVSGQVRILGLDPRREHAGLAPRLGVMPQDGGVYAGARPIEVLRLVAAFHADPDDPVALLERVGLSHRAQAQWRTLSGGEQQRLSLALALVGRPEVVFLDEPTAGIDPSGRLLVRQLIADLRTAGLAVVVTTHDLEEAEKVADRVVIIDRGHVVASGTPAVGSSRNMTSGRPTRARASDRRCCSPPDSVRHWAWARWVMPTRSSRVTGSSGSAWKAATSRRTSMVRAPA